MNRTLVEKARTMLIDAILSPDLWAEAVGTANYLRNRCPTKALRKVTPEEAWSG
ncbi:Retrovirus-related Pol polyprotein from transposon TNT 1-94, partial [Trichinella sp. T8]